MEINQYLPVENKKYSVIYKYQSKFYFLGFTSLKVSEDQMVNMNEVTRYTAKDSGKYSGK